MIVGYKEIYFKKSKTGEIKAKSSAMNWWQEMAWFGGRRF